MMLLARRDRLEVVEWRDGVATRMLAAASTGADRLCVMEQRCRPGTGAPAHVHPGAEEVVVVLAGEAEVVVGEERAILHEGDAVVFPAGTQHAFTNAGESELHLLASFSSATPLAAYEGAETFEIGGVGGSRRDAHRAYAGGDEGESS